METKVAQTVKEARSELFQKLSGLFKILLTLRRIYFGNEFLCFTVLHIILYIKIRVLGFLPSIRAGSAWGSFFSYGDLVPRCSIS